MGGGVIETGDHGWGNHRDWRPWVEESWGVETMDGGVIWIGDHGWRSHGDRRPWVEESWGLETMGFRLENSPNVGMYTNTLFKPFGQFVVVCRSTQIRFGG